MTNYQNWTNCGTPYMSPLPLIFERKMRHSYSKKKCTTHLVEHGMEQQYENPAMWIEQTLETQNIKFHIIKLFYSGA
jgi:hypothetical protein